MSNGNHKRVLSRMGALELTKEQAETVSGGIISTLLSRILTAPFYNPDTRLDS